MIATTCYPEHVLYHKQFFLSHQTYRKEIPEKYLSCKIYINNKLKIAEYSVNRNSLSLKEEKQRRVETKKSLTTFKKIG